MKIKIGKIFIILISIMVLILIFSNKSAMAFSIGDIFEQGKGFIASGSSSSNPISQDNTKTLSDTIYNVLLALGVSIAVIIAAILGVKFMLGSAEQKADVQGMMIPFVVGCLVVFGAFGIWAAVVNALQSMGV